jgi:hypothetical protein
MNKLILSALLILFFACTNANAQAIPKWKLNDLKAAIAKADKPSSSWLKNMKRKVFNWF